jgi:hypothetical protein
MLLTKLHQSPYEVFRWTTHFFRSLLSILSYNFPRPKQKRHYAFRFRELVCDLERLMWVGINAVAPVLEVGGYEWDVGVVRPAGEVSMDEVVGLVSSMFVRVFVGAHIGD